MSTDGIYGPNAVPYGADGMGIDEKYPVDVFGGPYPESDVADGDELEAAGFPGRQLVLEGKQVVYSVLKVDGKIVATWDEGRWWTPEESEAWVATMRNPAIRHFAEVVNELTGLPNRAARRRWRR